MTQDEIIRMAREAGIGGISEHYGFVPFNTFGAKELERFAALVAAHEREKLMNVAIFSKWYEELDAAVLAEREACAKVCEDGEFMTFGCATAAIRARGEK